MNEILTLLFEASWRSAIVFMPLYLIYRLTQGKIPASWRYAIWWVFLLRLALPISVESRWSIFQWWATPAPIHTLTPHWRTDAVATPATGQDLPGKTPPWRLPVSAGLIVLWLLGMGWIGLTTARRLNRLKRITSAACEAPLEFQKRFATMLGKQRAHGHPRLLISKYVTKPTLWGLRRPNLILPHSLMHQQELERYLDFVLMHETGHLKRGDLWLIWLEWIVTLVFWFHPLVWLTQKLMHKEREKACDAFALNVLGQDQSKPYAYAILTFASGTSVHPVLAGAVHLSSSGRVLKDRLRELKKPPKRSTPGLCFFWAICMGVLSFCFLTNPSLATASPAGSSPANTHRAPNKVDLTPTASTATVLNASENGTNLSGRGLSTQLLVQIAFDLDAHQVAWQADRHSHFELEAKANTVGEIQQALRKQLRDMGLRWHWTSKQDTVYLLQPLPSRRNQRPNHTAEPDILNQETLQLSGATSGDLAKALQGFRLYRNVLDQSHFPGTYQFKINAATGDMEGLRQGLAQYGLKLVKTRAEVRVLVVTNG